MTLGTIVHLIDPSQIAGVDSALLKKTHCELSCNPFVPIDYSPWSFLPLAIKLLYALRSGKYACPHPSQM